LQFLEALSDDSDLPESVLGPVRAVMWMGHNNLSPKQLAILLICCGAARSMTPGHLSNLMKLHPPAVSLAVSELERRGYLRRNRSPVDRRTVRIEVTTSGRKLAEHWLDFTKERTS
jgi:DNA-binding MarR family transcriptional regulator